MYIIKETKCYLLCSCHDNSYAAGSVLKLKQRSSPPNNLLRRVKTIWSIVYVCKSNRIKIKKRRYQRNEISDLDYPKSFWKTMKNIFPGNKEKTTIPQSVKTDDGETVIDHPTIAQRFNDFFTGAVSRLNECYTVLK